ncbi:hypothetical protein SNOG_12887 [Parastagonospora nodorum SN15]|uniref:Uncharacterized protein n=1 Tax=Phaeosphaeria nodorum (strain SN15 / ATCC MYA-4574 / FGSC 10173) TaxID=321614 RepID=Q0U5S7_PHANO|nr:hypothetical protein SNOG_12887 [Parastagonospora nodorum SN15]EAT79687.1 hypothetical protein SNOG_12887 [Parastagonospora nodorum SN15]
MSETRYEPFVAYVMRVVLLKHGAGDVNDGGDHQQNTVNVHKKPSSQGSVPFM